jgi:hypothetical protein
MCGTSNVTLYFFDSARLNGILEPKRAAFKLVDVCEAGSETELSIKRDLIDWRNQITGIAEKWAAPNS